MARMATRETRAFRETIEHGEILAIIPQAVSKPVAVPEVQPNGSAGSIAIVTINGPLEQHSSYLWDNYEDIVARVEDALADEDVRAVVMQLDSPGGNAQGATEAHRQLVKLRAKYNKPLYAYANESACSAAYELACAADEIWLPDTGYVGSIGVIATLLDRTESNKRQGVKVQLVTSGAHKADRHADRPLTDDIVDETQSQVDDLAQVFWQVVAETRGMDVDAVQGLEARVFYGTKAVKAGIADGVSGFDEFLSMVAASLDGAAESTFAPTKGTPEESMKASLLALTKARDEALASVESAKTDKDRKKMIAAFEAAAVALAARKAEEDDAEEEEAEDEESEEEEERCEDDEEDEKSDSGDSDSGSTEGSTDGGEDAKALLGAKTGLYTYARLYRLACQVTGQTGVKQVFGALDGMGQQVKAAAKLQSRVARLEAETNAAKVDNMLAKARREGRISKAQVESLRDKGRKDPKFLKGFLSSLPKIARTEEDGFLAPRADANGNPPDMANEQQRILDKMAIGSGKTSAEFAAEVNAVAARRSNGAGPRF